MFFSTFTSHMGKGGLCVATNLLENEGSYLPSLLCRWRSVSEKETVHPLLSSMYSSIVFPLKISIIGYICLAKQPHDL